MLLFTRPLFKIYTPLFLHWEIFGSLFGKCDVSVFWKAYEALKERIYDLSDNKAYTEDWLKLF